VQGVHAAAAAADVRWDVGHGQLVVVAVVGHHLHLGLEREPPGDPTLCRGCFASGGMGRPPAEDNTEKGNVHVPSSRVQPLERESESEREVGLCTLNQIDP
jgi:hypothetical protein